MAPHSSTLAWKIPWTEEPGRLQSMGSLRVGHDWVTSLSLFTFMHWRRKWQPTPVSLPGESQGWRSLVGCRLWGHTQTRLKRLSSSSSKHPYMHVLCNLEVIFLGIRWTVCLKWLAEYITNQNRWGRACAGWPWNWLNSTCKQILSLRLRPAKT